MRYTATKIFTYLTAIIIFTATGVYAQSRLDNSEWKLIEADGRAVTRGSAAIKINEDSTGFTGSTGCNRMFGDLAVNGRRIEFRNIGSTKRMCKLPAGNVPEIVFMKALNDARTFRKSGNTLRLMDRRGRVVLRFTKMAVSDTLVGLDDKKWVLESIKGRQTFVPLPYAFINFDAQKGSVGGDTSCNVFGGSYRVAGNTIKITDVISTMRACIEDNKMSVERDMLEGLRNASRYEIRDGRLNLYSSREVLLTFRGENK